MVTNAGNRVNENASPERTVMHKLIMITFACLPRLMTAKQRAKHNVPTTAKPLEKNEAFPFQK